MNFIKTLTILEAIKAQLETLKTENGEALFNKIHFYDATDIDAAFRDLNEYKQRICLIIPAGDTHQNKIEGRVALMDRKTVIQLLIADRDWRNGQTAAFGGSNNYGVINMKDAVVQHLAGNTLGINGLSLLPEEGDDLNVSPEKKDAPGRKGWLQRFGCHAGGMRVNFR